MKWNDAIRDVKQYRKAVNHNETDTADQEQSLYDFGTADISCLLEIIEAQARALDDAEETIREGWRTTGTKAAQRQWRRLAQAASSEKIEWGYPL